MKLSLVIKNCRSFFSFYRYFGMYFLALYNVVSVLLVMLLMTSTRLDKTKFHIIGAILFTAQSALLHPTAVVKTRMQVAGSGLSHMRGLSVFWNILKSDGISGLYRGFGTSAIGSLPGRVLALTSLEVSKDMMLKYTGNLEMYEATRVGLANGVAGMISNLVSCIYYVPLDVVGQPFLSSFVYSKLCSLF